MAKKYRISDGFPSMLEQLGAWGKAKARRNLAQISYGKIYFHPDDGSVTIRSRPGDAPNTQTGALSSTIGYKVVANRMTLSSGGAKAKYSEALEEGYRNMRAELKARPNLKTVFQTDEGKAEIDKEITKLLKSRSQVEAIDVIMEIR